MRCETVQPYLCTSDELEVWLEHYDKARLYLPKHQIVVVISIWAHNYSLLWSKETVVDVEVAGKVDQRDIFTGEVLWFACALRSQTESLSAMEHRLSRLLTMLLAYLLHLRPP